MSNEPQVPVNVNSLGVMDVAGSPVGDVVFPGQDIERAMRACELRACRKTYTQIAEALGYSNPEAARRAVQGALAWQGAQTILESRELMLLHLDLLAQVCWRVLEANHLVVSNGRVVKLKGETLKDPRPVLEAVDRLIAIERERKSVLGIAAPKRHEVMITHDTVDTAILTLERELAAAAGGQPPPTE